MRTDSTRLSSQAIDAARNGIMKCMGTIISSKEFVIIQLKVKLHKKHTKPFDHLVQVLFFQKNRLRDREFKLYDLSGNEPLLLKWRAS